MPGLTPLLPASWSVRRGAWGGRTVAGGTLGAAHVSRVPESGWPLPLFRWWPLLLSAMICRPDGGKTP